MMSWRVAFGTIHREATTKIAIIAKGIPVTMGINGRRLIVSPVCEHAGQRRNKRHQQPERLARSLLLLTK